MRCVSCALLLLLLPVLPRAARNDWPHYGHDPGAMRYSPLRQIHAANVPRLRRAWTFHNGKPGSETTPIVVNGVLYLTAPNGVFALEPETGKVIWEYAADGVALRGLAYWPGATGIRPRVFAGVQGGMVALDAASGKPAPGFGREGTLDLRAGVSGGIENARFNLHSPPIVFGNLVIAGGSNGENSPSTGAYGDIRAFDARTGSLVWTFHTVPRPGEPGSETWPENGWKQRSGTNVWGFMTLDTQTGILYAPIGSPTSDFYGVDRTGNNLYGNSLVALDAATGKLRWYQQLVHHDLWDLDPAAPPPLFDAQRNGKNVPAVAQITKSGLLFVFERDSGKPVWGMEERPVPKAEVPGEITSPTQPIPVKPPPLARTSFRQEDIYHRTPDHAAFCRELFTRNQMKIGSPYTPMPLEGNLLIFPSTLGGGNWGGVSIDPVRHYLFVNVMNIGQWGHMEKRKNPKTGEETYVRTSEYGAYARFWNRETRVPCSEPPFGELVAVDTRSGDIAWKVPLGTVPSLEALGVRNTGALNLGGSMATAGGLVFIGATHDRHFRAFSSETGQVLWEEEIESNAHSNPITYLGKDRRQYVVIMAGGGGGFFGAKPSDTLVAFALPRADRPEEAPLVSRSSAAQAGSGAGPAELSVAPAKPLGASAAQALVERSCGKQCHNLQVVTSQRLGRQDWAKVVQSMAVKGARGSPEELRQIVNFLALHYGH